MLAYPENDSVIEVSSCSLVVGEGQWIYAQCHRDAIAACWEEESRANSNFFNGTIHLIDALDVDDARLRARLVATDFASYLFWRRQGFPPAGVRDGFGSALIQSRDGAYLLGRQRAGNINAGLAYIPGGFIDARDVGPSGEIEIGDSIAREVTEETGLSSDVLKPLPGYVITQQGPHVSIARRFAAARDAAALESHVRRHIGGEVNSELEAVSFVRAAADLDGLAMPKFARLVLATLLPKADAGP